MWCSIYGGDLDIWAMTVIGFVLLFKISLSQKRVMNLQLSDLCWWVADAIPVIKMGVEFSLVGNVDLCRMLVNNE